METTLFYLNTEIRDTITGFKGIVLAENHKMSGENQLYVQNKELKDGAPARAIWLNSERVKVVSRIGKTPKVMAHNIILGEKSTCLITEFKGVAVELTFWVYECIRVAVQPIKLKKGLPEKEIWFDEARLIPSTKKRKEKRPPGGPARMDSPDVKISQNC